MGDETTLDATVAVNPAADNDTIEQFEPNYALECSVPMEVVKDWIFNLVRENTQHIRESNKDQGAFATSRVTQFIFSMCHKFRLSREVKHHAIILFDRFQRIHLEELHDLLRVASESVKRKEKQWSDMEDRVADQMTLRAITCIQIANKLVSQGAYLSLKYLRDELRKLGHTYSPKQIMRSEMRVLKTLKYKINTTTPCVVIQTLIKSLHMWNNSLNAVDVNQACWDILDVVVINRRAIYSKLLANYDDNMNNKHFLESDYMLLSCAVIVAAVTTVHHADCATNAADELHGLCGIPVQDIVDLAATIIKFIVDRHDFLQNKEAGKVATDDIFVSSQSQVQQSQGILKDYAIYENIF